jgi:hypothetical protein
MLHIETRHKQLPAKFALLRQAYTMLGKVAHNGLL